MDNFLKTELGVEALKQRTLNLNARQRRLLLLIGTDDFEALNPELKSRLASPELLQQLEDLGLIFQNNIKSYSKLSQQNSQKITENFVTPEEQAPARIQSELSKESTVFEKNDSIIQPNEHLIEPIESSNDQQIQKPVETVVIEEELTPLDFNEVKELMMGLLKQYCGLMAKKLVMQIDSSENLRALKLCQMQWITALQETRISPVQLNKTLKQINLSLK